MWLRCCHVASISVTFLNSRCCNIGASCSLSSLAEKSLFLCELFGMLQSQMAKGKAIAVSVRGSTCSASVNFLAEKCRKKKLLGRCISMHLDRATPRFFCDSIQSAARNLCLNSNSTSWIILPSDIAGRYDSRQLTLQFLRNVNAPRNTRQASPASQSWDLDFPLVEFASMPPSTK